MQWTKAAADRSWTLLLAAISPNPSGWPAETAVGLAGVGDLEVTGLSGRNKIYGMRIGKGEPARSALEARWRPTRPSRA
jgi:glycerol-3-phosphate dehydrogenase (NAD(P)+)